MSKNRVINSENAQVLLDMPDSHISPGATGIHFVFPFFFYSQKKWAATDLHFMNYQGPWFQLKIIITVLLKKKKSNLLYILDGLRVSKLAANFNFWVNYLFNLCYTDKWKSHMFCNNTREGTAFTLYCKQQALEL